MSLSERETMIYKRDSIDTDFQGSFIKRTRLDDVVDEEDDDVLLSVSSSSSSSMFDSVSDSDGFSSVVSVFSSDEIVTDSLPPPFLDLKANIISTLLLTNNLRRQSKETLGEMESAATKTTSEKEDRKKSTEKTPTKTEIDEFFSAAERYEQKRFTEKYNFDIVNDTPLEGRYQWVSLKP